MSAPVGSDAVHPAPEGRWLPQLIQTGQHGDQHILSGILGVLLLLQHLFAVVVDPILSHPHQGVLGVRLALPGTLDQLGQLVLFHFSLSTPLSV